MKKLILPFAIAISCTSFSWGWGPPDYSLTANTDTRSVVLSTITSAAISTGTQATQLLTRDSVQRSLIYFSPSIFPVYISTGSTFNNVTTMFQVPASTGVTVWTQFSPDGVNSPYAGNLFAVSGGSNPATASIFRTK